jgi:hypothetical protein
MTSRPHDLTDLYLAPVALAIDARIRELGALDVDALTQEVALRSDKPDYNRERREEALLIAVGHLVDRHGWELSWDPRGIRLDHDEHSFVLGTPAVFTKYLESASF